MSSASEDQKTDQITLQVPTYLLMVLLALTVPVWIVYSQIHKNERVNASSHQNEIAFSECIKPDLSNFSTCLKQSVESDYDQTKEYYDLKVQQDMANWALLMLVVTGVGVGYIALTLHATNAALEETRKTTAAANSATNQTRRIGEAQVRAYLSLKAIECPQDGEAILRTVFINTGNSPARNLSIWQSVVVGRNKSGDTLVEGSHPDHEEMIMEIGAGQSEALLLVSDPDGRKIKMYREPILAGKKMEIWFGAEYSDVFGRRFLFQGSGVFQRALANSDILHASAMKVEEIEITDTKQDQPH